MGRAERGQSPHIPNLCTINDVVLSEDGEAYPLVFGKADPETEKRIGRENQGFTLKSGEVRSPWDTASTPDLAQYQQLL